MAKKRKWAEPIGYTLHRGEYGREPESVARFESDGRHLRATYGVLREEEEKWLAEYLPAMHGTGVWGSPCTPIGPVRIVADA